MNIVYYSLPADASIIYDRHLFFVKKHFVHSIHRPHIQYERNNKTRSRLLNCSGFLFGIYLMTVTFSFNATLVFADSLPSRVTFRVTVVALLVALPVGSRFL